MKMVIAPLAMRFQMTYGCIEARKHLATPHPTTARTTQR